MLPVSFLHFYQLNQRYTQVFWCHSYKSSPFMYQCQKIQPSLLHLDLVLTFMASSPVVHAISILSLSSQEPCLKNSTVRAFTHFPLPRHLFHSTTHLCVLITIMTISEACCCDILYFLGTYQVPFIFLLPQDENYAFGKLQGKNCRSFKHIYTHHKSLKMLRPRSYKRCCKCCKVYEHLHCRCGRTWCQ